MEHAGNLRENMQNHRTSSKTLASLDCIMESEWGTIVDRLCRIAKIHSLHKGRGLLGHGFEKALEGGTTKPAQVPKGFS